jgi:hypothetical protein
LAKVSQRQFRFLALLAAALTLAPPAFAQGEVSMIVPPDTGPVICSGAPEYMPLNPTFKANIANCQACKAEMTSAINKARGMLAAAKGADGGVNASTTAGTGLMAATVGTAQEAYQSNTNGIKSLGGAALGEQSGIAQKVSQAMKECEATINSACSKPMGMADTGGAKQAAQSCQQAGAQADAVSGDKLAKAAEALKAAGQAAQQAMGMMGQGGGGGGEGGGSGLTSSGLDLDSNKSGLGENAPSTKLEPVANAGGSSLEPTSPTTGTALGEPPGNASELSSSRSPASAFLAGSGASPGMKGNSFSSGGNGQATNASSGSFGGSSGAGSGTGSSDGSNSSGASAAGAGAAGELAGGGSIEGGGYASEGGGPLRSTLGLQSSGEELNELMNEGGGLVASASAGDAEMAAQNQGADWEGRLEQSLFSRVKKKITQVSSAKGM